MSFEKLAEGLARRIDRRNAIAKIGAGAMGGLFALMGVKDASALYYRQCCTLCKSPSTSCSGCAWCWECCNQNGTFRCCEYGGACNGSCSGVTCSRITKVNNWACA